MPRRKKSHLTGELPPNNGIKREYLRDRNDFQGSEQQDSGSNYNRHLRSELVRLALFLRCVVLLWHMLKQAVLL